MWELEDAAEGQASYVAQGEALDAFRGALMAPQGEIAKGRAHSEVMERLAQEVGAHLRERTDRLMAGYRGTAFGQEYRPARTGSDP